MSRRWLVVCALVAMAGCRDKDKWDKMLAEAEDFKDKLCACKDKACVDGVDQDMKAWDKAMNEKLGKDEKPPDKVADNVYALMEEMRECTKGVRKAAGVEAVSAAIKMLSEFKDQMCACKDVACANKVSDEMTKWSHEKPQTDAPPDVESLKQMEDLTKQMTACMTKAMTPATP
jgi:hypothetical protein